jgi:iron complex outermembrane recepter protein
MNGPRWLSWMLVFGIAALTLTSGGLAQTDPGQSQPPPPAAEDEEEEPQETILGETIVVTAEKREQPLQKTPAAITALTEEDLVESGVPDIRTLGTTIPSVHIGLQEGNYELNIRGIGSSNNTELGDPAAALHIDGVYIPRPRGSGAMFFDVDRVEVLRGPQGTLYGRNATAGTMNIIPQRPRLRSFDSSVEVESGNYSRVNVRGMINVPLGETSAFRLAGLADRHDPYLENSGRVISSVKGTEDADDRAFRAQYLWRPSERFSLVLGADQVVQDGNGYSGINEFGGFADDPRITNYFDQLVHRAENSGYTGILSWKVWANAELFVQFGHRKVDYKQETGANSATGTQINYSKSFWDSKSESDTLEVRLQGDANRFHWTAGVFGFDEDQDVFLGSTADRAVVFAGVAFDQPDVQTKSRAVFGEVTFDVNERQHLTLGGRYTDDEKFREGTGHIILFLYNDGNAFATGHRFGTPGFRFCEVGRQVCQYGQDDNLDDLIDPNQGTTAPSDISNDFINFGDESWTHTDYKIAYSIELNDDQLVYGSVQTAYKAGGFNDGDGRATSSDIVANGLFAYDPEELTAYEIGSKNVWRNGRLLANFALFHYDYTDQQFSTVRQTPAGGRLLLTTSAAESTIDGLEIDSSVLFGKGFRFDFGALFMNAEFDNFQTFDTRVDFDPNNLPRIDLSGNQLPKAPDYTVRLALSQGLPMANQGLVRWSVSTYTRDDHYLNIFNGPEDLVESYTLVDASIGYVWPDGRFEAAVFGNNLTDETFRTSLIQTPNLLLGFYNVPRTYGVRFKVNM